jgi:hypothetical protein
VDQVNERSWVRLFPWRRKNKADSDRAQIEFAPTLAIARENGWVYLQLQLVNRSSWAVWVQEAAVALSGLEAKWHATNCNGQARFEILQNVGPDDTLCVSLARTIYDAAGRPQGPYSCFVKTNVRYRVFDEWRDVKLETYRVEMAAITVRGLHRARRCDKKIEQSHRSVSFTTEERKG